MKILAIIGTPTGEDGVSTQSVRILEKSFRAQREVEFDYLYLRDVQLSGCVGKLSCVKYGEHKCPVANEMDPLLVRMHAADIVIFASPVHCFNVSTLMKNMIDLMVYQMHRPGYIGKKAIVVATAAGAGQGGVLKYLRKTVANWGFDVVGQFGTHAGFFSEQKYLDKLTVAADNVAREALAKTDAAQLPEPGVAELINFRVWRSAVVRANETSPYDLAHWQKSGWLEADYYYPAKVNIFAKGIASLVEKIIAYVIKNASVKPMT